MANAQVHATNAAQNPLCGRLQQKFSGRGAAAVAAQYQARTASKTVTNHSGKVAKAVNPFEETAEFVPAGKSVRVQKTVSRNAVSQRAVETRRTVYNRQQHTQTFTKATPFASGAYATAYARAASIRAQAAAVQSRPHAPAKAKEVVRSKQGLRQLIRGGRADEVRVKSSPVPKGLVIAIVLFTAIVMMIVFSFAQINEFKREISDLEAQRSELNGEIDQLAIQLDLKNDVRVIEQTAREDIGMVRRNQVESKYINIAQGDRVEVIDDAEENTEEFGIFTTLLSSVGSGWDKLLEYID